MFGTDVRDRTFKTVILAFLGLSIVLQILVSAWFYDKLKALDSRLSQYPVDKPVEVELRVTIPELRKIDHKIDTLTQRLDKGIRPGKKVSKTAGATESEISPGTSERESTQHRTNHIAIVEKIGN